MAKKKIKEEELIEEKVVNITDKRMLNLEDFCGECKEGNHIAAGFRCWFVNEKNSILERKPFTEWRMLMDKFLNRKITN